MALVNYLPGKSTYFPQKDTYVSLGPRRNTSSDRRVESSEADAEATDRLRQRLLQLEYLEQEAGGGRRLAELRGQGKRGNHSRPVVLACPNLSKLGFK